MLPRSLEEFIGALKKLPGIGGKTAERLGFYLLSQDDSLSLEIASVFQNLKKGLVTCEVCGNIGSESPCPICSDAGRDQKSICVVENVIDLYVIEETHSYHGLYHVLGGVIDPLNGVAPADLNLHALIERVKKNNIRELVFATSPTTEGDTTAMYIMEFLKENPVRFTYLARGIPVGTDLQYAGSRSLARAILSREEWK